VVNIPNHLGRKTNKNRWAISNCSGISCYVYFSLPETGTSWSVLKIVPNDRTRDCPLLAHFRRFDNDLANVRFPSDTGHRITSRLTGKVRPIAASHDAKQR